MTENSNASQKMREQRPDLRHLPILAEYVTASRAARTAS